MVMKNKLIGVTLGWDGNPHLMFEGERILWGDADKKLFPQYFLLDGSIDYKKVGEDTKEYRRKKRIQHCKKNNTMYIKFVRWFSKKLRRIVK